MALSYNHIHNKKHNSLSLWGEKKICIRLLTYVPISNTFKALAKNRYNPLSYRAIQLCLNVAGYLSFQLSLTCTQ